ncbi:hypothetical protein BURMUCF1_2446 [Burkholderia multivorans ATCC BAA-247]|nr:hypothetical protein BURMUCF1_2446 [Burkholderia multivorans ATCC BAA-247]
MNESTTTTVTAPCTAARKRRAGLRRRQPPRRPHALSASVAVRTARRVSLYNIGGWWPIWPHSVPHAKSAPARAFAQWHATDSFTFLDIRRVI